METPHGLPAPTAWERLQAHLLERRRVKANHRRAPKNAAARKKAARKRGQASRKRNRQ